jgi:GT2 family glycosyltransferase
MSKLPLVSIVITSFNRLDDLKETIQRTTTDIKYPNLEVIVVDGGSTDGSVDYLQMLNHRIVIPIILGEDRGSAYSHNKGMEAAKGEFVITIDDDCFMRPSIVGKIVEIFQANSTLGVIGLGLVNPNIVFSEEDYWSQTNFPVVKNQFTESYQSLNYTSASAFRKSALEEVGYIDYSWSWSSRTEDVELNVKLIANGYNSVMIPELVAYHKVTPSNRRADLLTINGIHGIIWILLKYFPTSLLIKKLFKLIYLSIYFSILKKELFYFTAIFRSLKKAHIMYRYKKKLPLHIAKIVHLPDAWLFCMSSDMQWAGTSETKK